VLKLLCEGEGVSRRPKGGYHLVFQQSDPIFE
jgi:hypothetical protein